MGQNLPLKQTHLISQREGERREEKEEGITASKENLTRRNGSRRERRGKKMKRERKGRPEGIENVKRRARKDGAVELEIRCML